MLFYVFGHCIRLGKTENKVFKEENTCYFNKLCYTKATLKRLSAFFGARRIVEDSLVLIILWETCHSLKFTTNLTFYRGKNG